MTTHAARPLRNADPAELAKFAALAHHWWDPEHEMFGTLHKINPLRLGWIEGVAGDVAGKRVVDVGCGGGILVEALAGRSPSCGGLWRSGPVARR